MFSRVILVFWLVVTPATVLAVDLTAMEAMIEALERPVADKSTDAARCNYKIAEQVGRELPSDFDFCQPERQPKLISNGLYVNTEDEIKPFPGHKLSRRQVTKVSVPQPVKDNVLIKPHTPFVIELELPTPGSADNDNLKFSANSKGNLTQHAAVAPQISKHAQRSQPVFGCPDFQTFAHRGSSEEAENSIQAVSKALQSGHNGVEIDVQQLKDGSWVVHHDLSPGRVSYGQNGLITNMTSQQWRQVRLKDSQGSETNIQAPFLDELLIAYRRSAAASQILNIEVKDGLKPYDCSALSALNQRVLSQLQQTQFLYSSRSMKHLSCLRAANPNVYLGLVIDPHPNSIDMQEASMLGQVVSRYDRAYGTSASENFYIGKSNRDYLTRTSFADVRSLIGPYYGFHIDYRDYSAFASGYSAMQGRLMLYQLDDDQGLVTLLKDIKKQHKKLPDAVLVDSGLESYCALGRQP